MTKKKKIGVLLFALGICLIIVGCFNINKENKINKNYKITFKDVSFVKGKYLSDLKYLSDQYFADKESVYSIEGKVLFDIKDYYNIFHYNDLFILEKDNDYEVLDNNFNKVFENKFEQISVESDNCIFLYKDTFGAPILYNPNTKKQYDGYDDAIYISDSFILLIKRQSNEIYLLDIIRNEINKTNYFDKLSLYNVSSYKNKYLVASESKMYFPMGVFDKNGKEIIEAKYKNIEVISDDFLLLETDEKYSIIKGVSQSIIDIEKKGNSPISNRNIYVAGNLVRIETEKNNKEYYGVYDLNKNLIYSSSSYVYISKLSDDKSIILDGKNKICKEVISNGKKTKTKNLEFTKCGYSDKNGYIAVELSDKIQVLNSDFDIIFEGDYKYIDLEENYFVVEDKSRKIKIFSYDGKELTDKIFDGYERDYSNGGVFLTLGDKKYYFNYN